MSQIKWTGRLNLAHGAYFVHLWHKWKWLSLCCGFMWASNTILVCVSVLSRGSPTAAHRPDLAYQIMSSGPQSCHPAHGISWKCAREGVVAVLIPAVLLPSFLTLGKSCRLDDVALCSRFGPWTDSEQDLAQRLTLCHSSSLRGQEVQEVWHNCFRELCAQ